MFVRIALLLLLAWPAAAGYDARLVDAGGKPVAGAQISVVDQQATARTDAGGRFTLLPPPRLPATLVIIGSRGELFPAVTIQELVAEIRLEAVFRESVTVTLGAAPNIEGSPASAPVVIGSEELEQRKPAHVVEAISETPGVSVRGEGPPAVPVIRGLAGGRTLLIIDDARVVAERRAGPSATFVDPATLGSIEVSRGPGSVAYGSDAIGGVVHVRPRDPVPGEPRVEYAATATTGGSDEQRIAADVSFDALGGAMLVGVHGGSGDDAEDATGTEIANSQYDERGGMLRFVRDTEWGRTRTGFMVVRGHDIGAPSSDPARTVYPDERASLLTFAADVNRSGFWSSAALRASLGAYSITTERIRTTGVESSAVKARDGSLRLSGEHAGRTSRLTGGVDFVSRFNLRASGSIDDADRYDVGAYTAWSSTVSSRAQLAAGARVDSIAVRNHGGWFGDDRRDDVALSGYAALTAGLADGVTATIQAASGYREPSLSDRYYRGVSGRGFIVGNPALEPERSVQFDGGVRWNGERARAALFLYDYRIRNLVERYRSGANYYFRNRGEAEVKGVEVEGSVRLQPTVEIQAGGAIARGRDMGSGAALDDIAPPTLFTSIRWAAQRFSAYGAYSAFARDSRPGPVEVERPGYNELEIGGGWRFSPYAELRVTVRNATNRAHFGSADAAAAMAPGRTFVIGINR